MVLKNFFNILILKSFILKHLYKNNLLHELKNVFARNFMKFLFFLIV